MRFVGFLLGVAAVLTTMSSSWATATVEKSGTGVSAITPAGRARVAVGSQVEGQTRIVVGRGPAARETVLRYDDGCEVRLRPGQVYTILDASPCPPPAAVPVAAATVAPVGIGTTAIVGVAVAGAIAGGVIAATSGKGSTSVPPYISP